MVSLKKLSKQCNIGQKQGDHRQTKCDLSLYIDISKIDILCFHSSPSVFNLYATTNETIPKSIFPVNAHRFTDFGDLDVAGNINTTPNQPAERFTNISDSINHHLGSTMTISSSFYQQAFVFVNQRYL